jgi:hypothetical protein
MSWIGARFTGQTGGMQAGQKLEARIFDQRFRDFPAKLSYYPAMWTGADH